MRSRSAPLVGLAVLLLAACNALTGASDLTVSDEAGDAQVIPSNASDASARLDVGSEPDVRPSPPDADLPVEPPDSGDAAAPPDASDTDADASVPCTSKTMGPLYGNEARTTMLGNPNWTNLSGIRKPGDGDFSHSNGGDPNGNPNTITVSEFGFALPAAAIIKGIRVEIARTAIGEVIDDRVALPKGGDRDGLVWPPGPFDGPFVTQGYGDGSDLWGASWTASDFNSPTFSVSLRVVGKGDGHADSVGVIVSYCVPGT